MRKKIIGLLLFTTFIFSMFAQNGSGTQKKNELVIKVTLDKKNYSSLDQNSKAFVSAAYMQFLRDLTILPQISLRTAETDNELREIQKQSQIEAATGLGSEDAAYSAEKGSRADLAMNLSLTNLGSGTFQITCSVSEIETMNLVCTENTERLSIASVTEDVVIDKLVYQVLSDLSRRGYIATLSVDVTNQLLHRDNSEESFRKYVQEYTRQREEAERELADLRSKASSEEERMAQEAQELALQLKIEMAEKNRQIAEENLRRQQNEAAKSQKQQQEMQQMQNAQREKFLQDIQAIEAARTQIRRETLTSLPLKKRIELIENARGNLARLENQLAETIRQSNAYYDEKMNAEIAEINSEPWRKADLSNGEPTQRAKNFRNQQIAKVRDDYNNQKKTSENQLRQAAKPTIESYKAQVQSNLSDMEKTTYVFRSIDVEDDYLSLEVSEFDGNRMVWDVYSDFNLGNIQKVDLRKVVLPNTNITYEAMAGSKANLNTAEGYQQFQDTVDMADLYFRTSVPYLYSQIAIKIRYNESLNIYEITPVSFQIFKTQDNKKPIVSYNEKNLEAARKVQAQGHVQVTTTESTSTTTSSQDSSGTYSNYTSTTKTYSFVNKQKARNGIFCDLSYLNGSFYKGFNVNMGIYGGGNHIFAGVDADYVFSSVKSEYASSASASEFYLFSVDFVLGESFTLLGFIKPYVAAGIGIFSENDDFNSSSDTNLLGLCLEGMAGLDFVIDDFLSVGAVYKVKYLYGAGFVDSIGGSIGLVW